MSIVKMIPVLTTPSGSALTPKNWQEAGVQRGCYYLEALLIKPGLSYLKSLPDWSRYSGWQGEWVLNASMPKQNAEGLYVFRSPYDGTTLTCSLDDIADVILSLQPGQIILPTGFEHVSERLWEQLPKTTKIVVPVQDIKHYHARAVYGIHYVCHHANDALDMLDQHALKYPQFACYLSCHHSCLSLERLNCQSRFSGEIWVETDMPAKDACFGIVYGKNGSIDIKENVYATQFECIDDACHCPTCQQKLTRAYLHYLFEHTPLLCMRLLIQHNVWSFNVGWTSDPT